MPKILDKTSDRLIGTVSDAELQYLVDKLEEESSTDRDYYIDVATVEMFVDAGAPGNLVAVLRDALGEGDECEIRWVAD